MTDITSTEYGIPCIYIKSLITWHSWSEFLFGMWLFPYINKNEVAGGYKLSWNHPLIYHPWYRELVPLEREIKNKTFIGMCKEELHKEFRANVLSKVMPLPYEMVYTIASCMYN